MRCSMAETFPVRRHNFGSDIYFYAPGLKRYETSEFRPKEPHGFVPISITGTGCALNCAHCGGRLLKSMRPAQSKGKLLEVCQCLAERGARGVLVSGGCDLRGRVPLLPYLEEIQQIKRRLPLSVIVHTGLVNEELAAGLREAGIDGAMLDIIGSDRTIQEVYHLNATIQDYESSLALLTQQGVPAMPHIVLGLHYGRLLGEETALQMIAHYPIATLVLVVLTPLTGTAMETVTPPEASELGHFFAKARLALADTPILLGCARPAGEKGRTIERLAIDAGLNGIAFPGEGTVKYARHKGLAPRFLETCCALSPLSPWLSRPIKKAVDFGTTAFS